MKRGSISIFSFFIVLSFFAFSLMAITGENYRNTGFTHSLTQIDEDIELYNRYGLYATIVNGSYVDETVYDVDTVYYLTLNHLPNDVLKEPAIGITTSVCGIKIYNKNTLLYSFSGSEHPLFSYHGYTKNSIAPFGPDNNEGQITIEFDVPAGYPLKIIDLVVGERTTLIRYFNSDGLFKIYLTSAFFIASFVWLFTSFFFRNSFARLSLMSYAFLAFSVCILIAVNLKSFLVYNLNSLWRMDISHAVVCLLPLILIIFLYNNYDFEFIGHFDLMLSIAYIPIMLFSIYEIFSILLENLGIFTYFQLFNMWVIIFLLVLIFLICLLNRSLDPRHVPLLLFALLLFISAISLIIFELFFVDRNMQFDNAIVILLFISMSIFTYQSLQMSSESLTSSAVRKSLMLKLYTDPMTKLLNREAFDTIINSTDRKKNSYCIIVIDINGLKVLNDRFGHDAGDRLIKDFAEALQKSTQKYSCQCFRLGGDEFAILVENTTTDDVKTIINQLENNFRPPEVKGKSFAYGAAFCSPGDNLIAKFREADEKMYYDKEKSRREVII